MRKGTTYVGLDVHKETIAVAVAEGEGGEVRSLGLIPNRPEALRRLVGRLGPAKDLVCAYEAGPCGYAVYRFLTRLGVRCVVVAPSLIPTKPGDRVKTDRRDAAKLARLLRSGELTPVWVPDEEHEALRDLTRAREDARVDLLRARHRLSKFLLRLGLVPPAGVKPWGAKHRQWLQGLQLGRASQQVVLREYLLAVEQTQERLRRLEAELAEAARTSRHAAVIGALQALRGVGLVTAVTLVAELGDLQRFRTPREVMAYAGLVPREASSGPRQHRGAITKTGAPRDCGSGLALPACAGGLGRPAAAAGGATGGDQGDRLAGAGSVASAVSASAGARQGTPAGRGGGGPGAPGVCLGGGSCGQVFG
jgi:transposase